MSYARSCLGQREVCSLVFADPKFRIERDHTLWFFIFVINALMLLLTSALSESLGLGFSVRGFVPAFLGALVVSVVSVVLSFIVGNDTPKK